MYQSPTSSVSRDLKSQSKNCLCPRVRKIGSKGAVLVTVWTLLVYASFASLSFERYAHFHTAQIGIVRASSFGPGVVALLGPLAGLVASSYFGRYKTLYSSLWLMWSGLVAIAVILVLYYLLPDSETLQFVAFSGAVIAEVVYFIGFTGFSINSVPFGLDQMPDASGDQICAFIHWYVWSIFTGIATSLVDPTVHYCLDFSTSSTHLFQSLLSVVLLTVVLSTVFLLQRWLTIEPEGTNPLKNVFYVLRFAAKNKTPVRRSAFTYWEAGIPSRIDLAKSKYGGPFTNEEVEDVKTCLRIVAVISSTIVAVAPFATYVSSYFEFLHALFKYSEESCRDHSLRLVLSFAWSIIFSLPVYDVLFHPLKKRCIPSTLKKAGVAQVLMICASCIMLVVSIVWYTCYSPGPSHCALISEHSNTEIPIDYRWVAAPIYLLFYTSLFLFLKAMMEFVCAQSPYNLKGLLVGVFFSVIVLSIFLGFVIYLIWKIGYQHSDASSPRCDIWFYLFTTIAVALGCVLWCAVAKWYKRRERDEPEMCRIFAENYYDH